MGLLLSKYKRPNRWSYLWSRLRLPAIFDSSPSPTTLHHAINNSDMDPKTLSSNWKRLQETLKKNNVPSPKRKTSDREPQNAAIKKRKTDRADDRKKPDRPKLPARRKRMSEGTGHGGEDVAPEARSQSRTAKPNEGRSPTLVVPILVEIGPRDFPI